MVWRMPKKLRRLGACMICLVLVSKVGNAQGDENLQFYAKNRNNILHMNAAEKVQYNIRRRV